jgi:hypothetical protein
MRNLILFVSLLIVSSCWNSSNENKSRKEDNQLFIIDIEKVLEIKKPFNLSSIANSVEYLKLKTPPKLIIGRIDKLELCNNNFFIHANSAVYEFDREGNYIRQIGKRGKGPGEYTRALDFFVDPNNNKIGISNYPRLLLYDLKTGKHIETIDFKFADLAIQDDILLGSAEPLGIYNNVMKAINYNQDSVLSVKNNIFFNHSKTKFGSMKVIREEFYYYDHATYFKGYENNDTIWEIKNNQIKPHLYLDMGKLKLPLNLEPNYSMTNFQKNGHKYKCVPRVSEDDKYVYMNINFRNGGALIDYCALYNKNSKEGYLVHGEKDAGIKDDLKFGPDFWPRSITRDYYISYIEAFQLIDYLDENPQLVNEKLKTLIKSLNESSNPVLILASKIKKENVDMIINK